jgi:glucose-6-phosphate isomerase
MNLIDNVGFNVIFDPITGKLEFPDIPEPVEPLTRSKQASCQYYLDGAESTDEVLYWMYTGLSLPADREKIAQCNLRFDLTVIRPGKIGREFIKTIGHYHCKAEGQDEDYPEIYEVVYGKATFLLQDENHMDAVTVDAESGTKVLMPPGYGHITINASTDFLVISDIVSSKCQSNYCSIKDLKGGAWLCVEDEQGKRWVENQNYKKHPKLRIVEPGDMPLIFGLSGPLYTNLSNDPKRFKCLNFPETCATF